MLIKHREDCLSINEVQSVKVEEGVIKFENYLKEIRLAFKVYADFEYNLKGVEIYEVSYTNKNYDQIYCSFAYNVACTDNRLTKRIVASRGKNAAYKFIKETLKECEYCKKY